MSRPMWVKKMIMAGFPMQVRAGWLTKVPLLGGALEHMLFKGDDILILPRETVVSVDESVPAAEDVMVPSKVIEHFIDEASFLWVMNTCICRESAKCEDYPIDLGCMFMGEAARDINPELGREVTREEAREHLRRCREAGLYHLVGRNKLDTVWLNVHPGDRLLTVCNCCTCCCMWRILPDVAGRISSVVTRMPGVTVKVSDRCIGCGTCVEETGCIARAISLQGDRAFISVDCRGCGRCAEVCPEGAIDVVIDDADFMRRSVERISDKVDVT
jgi:ferredoxin